MRTNLAEMGQSEDSGAGNGRFHPQKAWRVLAAAVVLLVLVVGSGCRQRSYRLFDLNTVSQQCQIGNQYHVGQQTIP